MDKALPYSKEAEKAVLGSAVAELSAAKKVTSELKEEMFYIPDHRAVFWAIADIVQDGGIPDNVAVTERLRGNLTIEQRPWASIVSDLWTDLPFLPNVNTHIKAIRDLHTLRQTAIVGMELTRRATEERDPQVVIEFFRQRAGEIFGITDAKGIADLNSSLQKTLSVMENRADSHTGLMGIATGFAKMDEMLTGLQKGDLVIIAARPSVGKTAMALNIASNVAIRQQKPVLVSSIEMSSDLLTQRIISAEALVNGQNLRTGDLSDSDWEHVAYAIHSMKDAPLFIDDNSSATVSDIRASAMRIKNDHGLELIIVDYLQLINGKGRSESRQQEVAEITRGLKSLARELNVPVICLAQVSRQVEQTQDRIPRLSHLKESGEIEQAADVVMFIHKETDEHKLNEDPSLRSKVMLIVAKQRNGPTGEFELGWRKEFVKYVDVE